MKDYAKKKNTPDKEEKDKQEKKELNKFYEYIHVKFKNTCAETGHVLRFNKKHIAHVLAKRKGFGGYPDYALDERNAFLLSWNVHHVLDFGSQQQKESLKIYPAWIERKLMLLSECGAEHKMTDDEMKFLNEQNQTA